MHKKPPTAHLKPHQFKPGQTGNPNGRPALTAVQRELRKLTLETYREVIELALTGNLDALRALIKNPDTPAIQVGVASSILTAIKKGDASVLERFAARLVGKIPDEIRINAQMNVTASTQLERETDAQLDARIERLLAKF